MLFHWSFSSKSRLGFFLLIAAAFPALSIDDSSWQVTEKTLLQRNEHFDYSDFKLCNTN